MLLNGTDGKLQHVHFLSKQQKGGWGVGGLLDTIKLSFEGRACMTFYCKGLPLSNFSLQKSEAF